jgi:Mg-chelatase subunit ChlD
LEAIVSVRRSGRPVDVDELVVGAWERPDTEVCLLLDRSGSMHGGRLATAALAAAAVVLRAPAACSVVAFAEDAIVLQPQGGQRRAEDVVDDVLRLRGHGVTDLGLALRTARAQLEHAPQGRRLTVLLSDCRATAGGDHLDDAAALDELTILAPADDDDDARALAEALGATCATFEGPSSVPEALGQALAP